MDTESDFIAAELEEIFAHRVSGAHRSGKWLVWELTCSERTAQKFVTRARRSGIRGVWCRDGRVGCLADRS